MVLLPLDTVCLDEKKVKVLVAQSCLTLCDPIDCSPPGSSVRGILQARILEWVAIPFSRGSSQARGWTQVSCIAGRFFTIWAIAVMLPPAQEQRQHIGESSTKRTAEKWSLTLTDHTQSHGFMNFLLDEMIPFSFLSLATGSIWQTRHDNSDAIPSAWSIGGLLCFNQHHRLLYGAMASLVPTPTYALPYTQMPPPQDRIRLCLCWNTSTGFIFHIGTTL